MSKLTKKIFIESLKEMTLLEIKELVDGLKEEFGIDPSSVAAVSTGNVGADNSEVTIEKEEKTEFTVVLKSLKDASKKIQVIKLIRDITNLGLIDAKKAAETGDSILKENIDRKEAEKIQKQLEELGAIVQLK